MQSECEWNYLIDIHLEAKIQTRTCEEQSPSKHPSPTNQVDIQFYLQV